MACDRRLNGRNMMKAAKLDLREQFQQDGFVIVRRPVVRAEHLADLRAHLDALHARFASLGPEFAGDLGPVHHHDGPPEISEILRVRLLDRHVRNHPAVRALADVARTVLGTSVWCPYDHSIYKPPGSPHEVAWHQDAAYDDAVRRAPAIHLWLALDDVGPDDGGMCYEAGSHRRGLLPHEPAHPGGQGHQKRAVGLAEPVDVGPLEAGSVIGHHPLTLHTSGPNRSLSVRRSWILHFQATWSARTADQLWTKLSNKARRAVGVGRSDP